MNSTFFQTFISVLTLLVTLITLIFQIVKPHIDSKKEYMNYLNLFLSIGGIDSLIASFQKKKIWNNQIQKYGDFHQIIQKNDQFMKISGLNLKKIKKTRYKIINLYKELTSELTQNWKVERDFYILKNETCNDCYPILKILNEIKKEYMQLEKYLTKFPYNL